MPRLTIELDPTKQQNFLKDVFLGGTFAPTSADRLLVSQLDPDLSVSCKLIGEHLALEENKPHTETLTERLIDLTGTKMTSHIPQEENAQIPKKRTNNDMSALHNVVNLLENLNLDSNDSTRKQINEKSLTLFGEITQLRPDLTASPEFPWKNAVHLAVFRPPYPFFSKFDYRIKILSLAPAAIVTAAMQEHASEKNDIINTLLIEVPPFWKDPLLRPDFFELVRRTPEGNQMLARRTLDWALRNQQTARFRKETKKLFSHDQIPQKVLKEMWKIMRAKWNALPEESRGTFLTYRLLLNVESLYKMGFVPTDGPLSGEIDKLLNSMVKATSLEGRLNLKREFTRYFELLPESFPCVIEYVKKWFPDVASGLVPPRISLIERARTIFSFQPKPKG